MINYKLDDRLPKLNSVRAIASNTAVGFEWQPLSKRGLDGINIYRTRPNVYANSTTKQLTKIATINSPFASHYVDTGLEQNSHYTYTFTTIRGEYESVHGKVIDIKTLPPLPKVTFFQGVQRAVNIIKLIWRPHPDKRVKMYRVERSVNGGKWTWIGTLKNRMMVEYLDKFVQPNNQYQYRIIAVGFDDSYSMPSDIVRINARR
jgi:fibronectin type 3 domain-containing protein